MTEVGLIVHKPRTWGLRDIVRLSILVSARNPLGSRRSWVGRNRRGANPFLKSAICGLGSSTRLFGKMTDDWIMPFSLSGSTGGPPGFSRVARLQYLQSSIYYAVCVSTGYVGELEFSHYPLFHRHFVEQTGHDGYGFLRLSSAGGTKSRHLSLGIGGHTDRFSQMPRKVATRTGQRTRASAHAPGSVSVLCLKKVCATKLHLPTPQEKIQGYQQEALPKDQERVSWRSACAAII